MYRDGGFQLVKDQAPGAALAAVVISAISGACILGAVALVVHALWL